jgi:hypothetical protein
VKRVRGKNLFHVVLRATLVIAVSGIIQVASAPTSTKVYADPNNFGNVTAGTTLVVDIKVDNVVGLSGWEFELVWDNWVLTLVSYSFGPFLSQSGMYLTLPTSSVSPFGGFMSMAELIFIPPGATTSGSGILATVTFLATGAGSTSMELTTMLNDNLVQPISHSTFNSKVTVHIAVEAEIVYPESKVFYIGTEPDEFNTLYADVTNHGTTDADAYVMFVGFGMDGALRFLQTDTQTVSAGGTVTLSNSDLDVTAAGMGVGTYWFSSRAYFSYGGQFFNGFKEKHLKFQVRP